MGGRQTEGEAGLDVGRGMEVGRWVWGGGRVGCTSKYTGGLVDGQGQGELVGRWMSEGLVGK